MDSFDNQRLWLQFLRDSRLNDSQRRCLWERGITPMDLYQSGGSASVPHALASSAIGCKDVRSAEVDYLRLQQQNAVLISVQDRRYPLLLRQIADYPLALYAQGNLALLDEPKVAMVGSRKPTAQGIAVTRQLSQQLARLGIVIVSGMAYGIDTQAHRALYKQEPLLQY